MSSLFFWFEYFTLDDVSKVKAVFVMVLDRTTQILWLPALVSLHIATKSTYLFRQQKGIGMPSVHNSGYTFLKLFKWVVFK